MLYFIQPTDTLADIAWRFNTTVESLAEMNGLNAQDPIFVGQPLVIWDYYRQPNPYSIEVDTKKRILRLLKNRVLIKQYRVAVGKASTPTPLGHWTITKKTLWGEQFGGHFMQLSVPWGIYGIHGTNKPWSIGQAVTHGCIRMYSQDAAEVYNTISIGTPVYIH